MPQAGITPPCSAIPFMMQAIVSSDTPAWKNLPLKSPFVKALVFFRKPSVLSEFDRSAEATIMFSTRSASTPSTVADAARVAESAFISIDL